LPKPKELLADKRCDRDWFCENLLMFGNMAIIRHCLNRKTLIHPDHRHEKDGNGVERMSGKQGSRHMVFIEV